MFRMMDDRKGQLAGWVFLIQGNGMALKVNGEWADQTLVAYNDTLPGAAEIARQWAEYDRRGCPLLSYQKPTSEATLPQDWESITEAPDRS